MPSKKFVASVFGLLISTVAAYAGPITTPPPPISAVGDVTAVYVYANAQDTSILNEVTPVSINLIFCNHPTGTCTGNNPGDIMDLGVQNGAMVFSLDDLNAGNHYTSNAPDADGNYHVMITTDFSVFGVGALPSGADSVIQGLLTSGQSVTYIGWEDRMTPLADWDYNDLIFAFANTTTTTQVPEPLTLSLFGAGLAGVALLRWRRRKMA